MVEGLVESMEISGSQYGKYFVPNSRRLYAAMVLTQQLYPKFTNQVRELAGGGMIMLPSSATDFANPEMAGLIGKTQHSPATDSLGRVKFFKRPGMPWVRSSVRVICSTRCSMPARTWLRVGTLFARVIGGRRPAWSINSCLPMVCRVPRLGALHDSGRAHVTGCTGMLRHRCRHHQRPHE